MTMLTWSVLSQFNENNPPTHALGRTSEVELKYSKFRHKILSKYDSVSQYLNKTLFTNDEDFIIKKNDFPYNTTKDIHHYILWINPKNDAYFTNETIKYNLELFFKNKYIFFKNNRDNMSIEAIKHYHIFLKI
tara:strand:- start:23403 stop:23801 length:399 start_codon:yes stop_codon:yes gene_type:complete